MERRRLERSFRTFPYRKPWTGAITTDRIVASRICQTIFEGYCARKRRWVTDWLVSLDIGDLSLGLLCPWKKKVARIDEEYAETNAELLLLFDNANLGCSNWRLSDIMEHSRPGWETDLNLCIFFARSGILRLLSHEAVFREWHEFLGFVPGNISGLNLVWNQILICIVRITQVGPFIFLKVLKG